MYHPLAAIATALTVAKANAIARPLRDPPSPAAAAAERGAPMICTSATPPTLTGATVFVGVAVAIGVAAAVLVAVAAGAQVSPMGSPTVVGMFAELWSSNVVPKAWSVETLTSLTLNTPSCRHCIFTVLMLPTKLLAGFVSSAPQPR